MSCGRNGHRDRDWSCGRIRTRNTWIRFGRGNCRFFPGHLDDNSSSLRFGLALYCWLLPRAGLLLLEVWVAVGGCGRCRRRGRSRWFYAVEKGRCWRIDRGLTCQRWWHDSTGLCGCGRRLVSWSRRFKGLCVLALAFRCDCETCACGTNRDRQPDCHQSNHGGRRRSDPKLSQLDRGPELVVHPALRSLFYGCSKTHLLSIAFALSVAGGTALIRWGRMGESTETNLAGLCRVGPMVSSVFRSYGSLLRLGLESRSRTICTCFAFLGVLPALWRRDVG